MHSTLSRCTSSLLRHRILPRAHVKTCSNLITVHAASRGLSFTAARRTARRTPAAALGRPADTKGKGKESIQSEKAGKSVEELPFLPRPLGVRERPSTIPRTWQEEMMDQETRMDHRRKLYVALSFVINMSFIPAHVKG